MATLSNVASAQRRFHSTLSHLWAQVPLGPPDAILGISEAFVRDTNPKKINLGVGAYRDADGRPWVLPSVLKASEKVSQNHEYAPVQGDAQFTRLATQLAFGEQAQVLEERRVAACQALSGTGALRLIMAFMKRFYTHSQAVYGPKPTWGNHAAIVRDSGLEWKEYRYYKPETRGLDSDGMMEDIEKAPEKSIFIVHACAHNPTGVDPTKEQWEKISQLMAKKKHFLIVDSAYQGFASGDPTRDAFAIRKFVEDGHQIALAQSFSKNFGLYGERVGCLSVVTSGPEETERVLSQLKILARPIWSNPPIYGSKLVTAILENSELRRQWLNDVKVMADRIISMRALLRKELERVGSKQSWKHITDQIGMFAYSGLNKEQVQRLASEFHIYMTLDGRISMAGVNPNNVSYLANAMHIVTKDN